jgi:hypothetical protein
MMALARPWVIASDLFPWESAMTSPTGTRPGHGGALIGSARSDSFALPGPRGAGLITDLGTGRQAQLGESLDRLFDRLAALNKPLKHQARNHPSLLPIALAIVALEVARRWRRRSAHRTRRPIRSRPSVMKSVL